MRTEEEQRERKRRSSVAIVSLNNRIGWFAQNSLYFSILKTSRSTPFTFSFIIHQSICRVSMCAWACMCVCVCMLLLFCRLYDHSFIFTSFYFWFFFFIFFLVGRLFNSCLCCHVSICMPNKKYFSENRSKLMQSGNLIKSANVKSKIKVWATKKHKYRHIQHGL